MKATRPLIILATVGALVIVAFVARAREELAPEPTQAQAEALTPTFIELGSDRCVSCSAMLPVLDELRSSHGCKLKVRFIDVWEKPEEGDRFGITTIPTQILLTPEGEEITRHTGFWSADSIRGAFASHGVQLASAAEGCPP